jgi:hypothetical protein
LVAIESDGGEEASGGDEREKRETENNGGKRRVNRLAVVREIEECPRRIKNDRLSVKRSSCEPAGFRD